MDTFSSLLRTFEPRKFEYKLDLFEGVDPVSWAYNLCRTNAKSGALTLQAMKSAFSEHKDLENDEAINFDTKNSNAVEGVLKGIAGAYAGHARFEIIYADSVTGFCWYEPAKKFYRDLFMDELKRSNPLGHYVQSTLWFSASKHVYEPHTDVADGFLFQIAGKKRVKVWGISDEFRNATIYNNDADYRQSMPYQEFDLEPGDVLFIPSGAVHEVTVYEGLTSLSMSFHLGGSYPLLALCSDLNDKYPDHKFTLQEEHQKTGKPYVTLFDPGYQLAGAQPESMRISPVLCKKLCEIIQSDRGEEELYSIIEEWWLDKLANPTYKGPYPTYKGFHSRY